MNIFDFINDEVKLSYENIAVQSDTTIVNILNTYNTNISEIMINNDIKEGKALRNRTIASIYAKMEQALEDRFGMPFKFAESNIYPMGILPVAPKNFNILSGDVKTMYDNMSYVLESTPDGEHSTIESKSDISTSPEDIKTKYANLTQSIDTLTKNAKFINYPKDAINTIFVSPYVLFKIQKLTPEEVTAIMLHEVGHAFTHLEYAYRVSSNGAILLDSVASEYKNNVDPLTAFKIGYSETFNEDLKADNLPTALIATAGKFIDDYKEFGNNSYALKDSERLADQFATRFGVGAELASALDKVTKKSRNVGGLTLIISIATAILNIMVAHFLLVVVALLVSGVVVAVMLIIKVIILSLLVIGSITLITAFLDKGVDKNDTYDTSAKRLSRIRSELIRELRKQDLPKDVVSKLLDQIDFIEGIIKKEHISDSEHNVIYTTVRNFFSDGRKYNEFKDIDDTLENLIENNLHVASNRLKVAF